MKTRIVKKLKTFALLLVVACLVAATTAHTNCKRKSATKGAARNANSPVPPPSNKSGANDANGGSNEEQTRRKTPKSSPDYSDGEMSAKEIARLALPAVVLILCDKGNGEAALGSGFFVEAGTVITNYHVIESAPRGSGGVRVEFWTGENEKQSAFAEITAYDEQSDLAILTVPAARRSAVQTLPLLPTSETIEIGETVFAVGNPEGLERTISTGIVSARVRFADKSARLQITAPISHGSSGGPVINAEGKVVGVAVSTMSEGQNLNFAVPAALVHSLLEKSKQNRTAATTQTSSPFSRKK